MSNHLLVFNLATDADDPVLGFTTNWLNRLAQHFDTLDVITMRMGHLAVGENVRVYSVGKERNFSDVRRTAAFYRLLNTLLAKKRYVACFAHMMPLFAVMGAPLLRLRAVPLTLWYTHRQRTRTLELAAVASARIVTAAIDSFPIPTPKLRILGHGIDTDFYHPDADATHDPLSGDGPRLTRTQEMIIVSGGYVVQVARLMPIKHQETLIRALVNLETTRAVLVGGTPEGADGSYEHRLRGLAHGLDLGGRVVFTGSQSSMIVREHYRRAIIALNLSPPGLFDKAALESMSMALPTFVASHAFDPLLGEYRDLLCLESPEDVDELTRKLQAILMMSAQEHARIGGLLRKNVVTAHSLTGLTERLVRVLRTGEL